MTGKIIRLVLWVSVAVALGVAGCSELPLRTASVPPQAGSSVSLALPGSTPNAPSAPEQGSSLRGGGFLRDLQALEAGRINHLHILQLGDSHTAGDAFTARLRARFQERFGDGGRGMMQPGLPFDGVRQKEVQITQTGRWTIENSRINSNGGPYGISGFVVRSAARDARMTMTPVDPEKFDSASIDFLRRPGGGSFEVRIDGKLLSEIATAGPLGQRGHVTVTAPPGAKKLEILARAPGIGFTAWSLDRNDKGVLLDEHGVISATVNIVSRWDPAMIQRDLDELHPSLIILAYGTNEGFAPDFDQPAYAKAFGGVIDLLRRMAPEASILVVGPPDGQRVDPACRARKSDPLDCRWATPKVLAQVRETQRQVAREMSVGFWDWSSVMAAPGGIDRLVRANPPLARADHVHFTLAGYEMAADALFQRLMDDYAASRGGTDQSARRQ